MEVESRGVCPNCGSGRRGRFCADCGQNDRNYTQAFLPVVWEILRETFELDSRLWRTLKGLLLRPGHLTIEFSHNRRASYVTPVRLYVFTSLLFFFLVSIQTDTSVVDLEGPATVETSTDEPSPPPDTEMIRDALDADHLPRFDAIMTKPDGSLEKQMLVGLARGVTEDGTVEPLERSVLKYAVNSLEDPRRFFDQMIDNLPIVMFVLLPVYTVLLVVFNVFKRRYLAEHLVFAVHFHTFVFIVFIALLAVPDPDVLSGTPKALARVTTSALFIALMVYGYAALKRFYGDGYVLTTIKYVSISVLYLLALIPAFIALTIFTATTI